MVFSATLTLPASMRRRLRKSGGGATGGTDLENLMDRWVIGGLGVLAPAVLSASCQAFGIACQSIIDSVSESVCWMRISSGV
jgi:hypothetical protein